MYFKKNGKIVEGRGQYCSTMSLKVCWSSSLMALHFCFCPMSSSSSWSICRWIRCTFISPYSALLSASWHTKSLLGNINDPDESGNSPHTNTSNIYVSIIRSGFLVSFDILNADSRKIGMLALAFCKICQLSFSLFPVCFKQFSCACCQTGEFLF